MESSVLVSPEARAFVGDAARVMRRCDELAKCSDDPDHIERLFLSPALQQSHELVGGWMREAGLATRTDEIGNLWGRVGPTDAPAFWIGSHLDSVPNAGRYDGPLGVLMGLEVIAGLVLAHKLRGQELPFALEVVGFSDEEGVRFGARCLGSRALCGDFNASLLELLDEDEISMAQAMANFGLAPDNWPAARADSGKVLGYLEAHIEQGPVLEDTGKPLAIVTAIAGQSRLRVRFGGRAGHAGTQPMVLRRDGLAAASEWILEVENLAMEAEDLVATVGTIEVEGAASNVVPGGVVCALDVRHPDDNAREAAVGELMSAARRIAARRSVGFDEVFHDRQSAVPMDKALQERLSGAAQKLGIEAPLMVSGAGHDAAFMAEICPASVLFLRTPGGESHNPAEAVDTDDVALGLRVMREFLEEKMRSY